MSLASGTQLGPYTILAQIGAGGMGEVYRAHDARLGREVAVKVLPPAFAEDPGRLHRFQQEARTVSALNHPNVITIHDVGTWAGSPYLVMELLEGETLREKMGSPLPLKRVLALGLDLAHGLAAAHEKGIVHRDLKPENVFLTGDGRVKLLDFGLAKLKAGSAVLPGLDSGETQSVDLDQNRTGAGTLVGTVAYMSPEQACGKNLDGRSDLFSLGVVLWELLTGKHPFKRASAVETLSAILKAEPPELPPGLEVNPLLERVLQSCLAKAPEGRFHSAHDLAFALQAAAEAGSAPRVSSSGAPVTVALPQPRRPLRLLLVAPVALVFAALLAGLALWAPWKAKALPYDPRTVAFLPFENGTGDPALDALGREVMARVRRDLQVVENLKVAEQVPPPGAGASARSLAELTRARYVGSASCTLSDGKLSFQARVVDPWAAKVVYELGPWQGARAEAPRLVEELHQRLAGAAGWCFTPSVLDFVPGAIRPPRMDVLRLYQKDQLYLTVNPGQVGAVVEQAFQLDPDFLWAQYAMVDVFSDRGDYAKAASVVAYMESHYDEATAVERIWTRVCRAYLDHTWTGVIKAIDELRAIHPDTPNLVIKHAEAALNAGLYHTVVRDLGGVPREAYRTWTSQTTIRDLWLCQALHLAGDYAGQLRAALDAQRAFPDVLAFRGAQAGALAGLGRTSELPAVLRTSSELTPSPGGGSLAGVRLAAALELHVHGHPEEARPIAGELLAELEQQPPERQRAGQMRAILLVLLSRWAEALEAVEGQASEPASDASRAFLLGRKGCLLARLGRREEARAVEQKLAALTDPHLFGEATYQRAALAAQLGERDRAVELLRRAFSEGFSYADESHLDLFLEPLHGYPPYEDLMKAKD